MLFYYFPVAAFIRPDAAYQATSFHLFQLVVNPISSYATYCSKFFISQKRIILDSIQNNFSSLIYLFLRSFLYSFPYSCFRLSGKVHEYMRLLSYNQSYLTTSVLTSDTF